MTTIAGSLQEGLSANTAERTLAAHGLKKSGVTVYSITKKFKGHGHWSIEVSFYKQLTLADSFFASVTTTNSLLIDNWEKQGSMNHALKAVLADNDNLENLTEWVTYPD